MKKHYKIITFIIICITIISVMHISYSKYTYNGNLSGTTVVPSKPLLTGIQITNIEYVSDNNANTVGSMITSYEDNIMNSKIVLKNDPNSSITYQITFTNYGNETQDYLTSIFITEDNEDIVFDISGVTEGTSIAPAESLTLNITFRYRESKNDYPNTILNSEIEYSFGKYDSFPEIFKVEGPCILNGSTTNITGDGCSRYSNVKYINTGILLYDEVNYNKDYEMYFEISNYNPNNQESGQQQTIMNEKLESNGNNNPGIVFRRSGNNLELTQTIQGKKKSTSQSYNQIQSVRIIRKSKVVYYSFNGGTLTELQNISSYNPDTFAVPVTFGASLQNGTTPFRYVKATISNISIKLGIISDTYWQELIDTYNSNSVTNPIDTMENNSINDIQDINIEESPNIDETNQELEETNE